LIDVEAPVRDLEHGARIMSSGYRQPSVCVDELVEDRSRGRADPRDHTMLRAHEALVDGAVEEGEQRVAAVGHPQHPPGLRVDPELAPKPPSSAKMPSEGSAIRAFRSCFERTT
jgi:hypothetical protein